MKHLKYLRHEILEKIHAIQENQQKFEKKCEMVQATEIFSRLSLIATKLFELTRSQMTWYYEGRELASAFVSFFLFFFYLEH